VWGRDKHIVGFVWAAARPGRRLGAAAGLQRSRFRTFTALRGGRRRLGRRVAGRARRREPSAAV